MSVRGYVRRCRVSGQWYCFVPLVGTFYHPTWTEALCTALTKVEQERKRRKEKR